MVAEQMNEEIIFHTACEIGTSDLRDAYLAHVCGSNSHRLTRVQALLKVHEEDHRYLNAPAVEFSPKHMLQLQPGDYVGPYAIREQIGEGGMGVVYAAEQMQPIRRRVALKVIKSGLATQSVLSRFEAERQALALMDHPNIAHVYDGGATDDGQPFFAMELVLGAPITDYCDQQRLTMRQRLQLFVEVCRAVQHAHQKGIIHRDLKPSNVLVANIDGNPVAKVIDFGVAKAVNQKLSDATIYTQVQQIVGTPLYISPEQLDLGVVDIDTRSDVYSLGVLLYELLTGTTPFDREQLKQANYDEMRRVICDEQPRRPSDRISTLRGEALSTVAKKRHRDPRKLSNSLRGELDWVVMRALEKDRNRRYESAIAMAEDVERYLGDEPVLARPPSRFYLFSKFARRNRALAASILVIVASLLVATILSTRFAILAQRNEQLARQRLDEVTREQEGNRILIRLLSDAFDTPHTMSSFGNQPTVPELLDEFSQRLDQELHDFPEVEMEIRTIFARNLRYRGEITRARDELDRVLFLTRKLYGTRHVKAADVLTDLAYEFEFNLGQRSDTPIQKYAQEAVSIYEEAGEKGKRMAQALYAVAWTLRFDAARQDEREDLLRRALQEAKNAAGGEDTTPEVYALWDLAACINEQRDGRSEEAIDFVGKALEMTKRLVTGNKLTTYGQHKDELTYKLMVQEGDCFHFAGRLDDATKRYVDAWDFFQQSGMTEESADHRAALRLAEAYFVQHRHSEAEEKLDEVERICRDRGLYDRLAWTLFLRGWGRLQREDYVTADAHFRDVLRIADQHLTPTHDSVVYARVYLASSQEALGNTVAARAAWDAALPLLEDRANMPTKRINTPYTNQDAPYRYARALSGVGGRENAEKALRIAKRGVENSDLAPQWGHKPHYLLAKANALIELERFEEAADALRQGLASHTSHPFTSHPQLHLDVPTTRRELEATLVECLIREGDIDGAHQVLLEGLEFHRKRMASDPRSADVLPAALAELRIGQFLLEHADFNPNSLKAAEAHLNSAWVALTDNRQAADANRRRVAEQLANLYAKWERSQEAATWEEKLTEMDRTAFGDRHVQTIKSALRKLVIEIIDILLPEPD